MQKLENLLFIVKTFSLMFYFWDKFQGENINTEIILIISQLFKSNELSFYSYKY